MVVNQRLQELYALTAFRFIGALLVFIFHVGLLEPYKLGYLGVSFFFMLSGFILTYNYCDTFKARERIALKKFYIARISKIYPLHLLTFLLAIPYYFFIPLQHNPILYVFQAGTNVLLVHSFIPFGNISFNGVSWSLSVELFFYAAFPFIIYYVIRNIKRYAYFITGAWLAIVCLTIMFVSFSNNLVVWFFYYFPAMRLLEFVAGILSAFFFMKFHARFKELSRRSFTILEGLSVAVLAIIVSLSPAVNENLRFGILFIPFWSCIIIIFAFQKGNLSAFLSQKIFVYLGRISFSFYMIHNLILSYIYFLWRPDIHNSALIMICLAMSLLFSVLLYHYVEEPMRKRANLFLGSKLRLRPGAGTSTAAAPASNAG